MKAFAVSDSDYFSRRPTLYFKRKANALRVAGQILRKARQEGNAMHKCGVYQNGSLRRDGIATLNFGGRNGYHIYYRVSVSEIDTRNALCTKFED